MVEGSQQRRIAVILAADVFGYSRLMATDEDSTLRTLKAHRDVIDRLIARHEGRIFNTAGDSVLAEFGSAVEAVRCAITIQDELRVRNAQIAEERRMEFRIGVNVGDVLVDGDNLYGDGVNIAARLEAIAAPGNICISGSVFSLVKNKLSHDFEDIGPQLVKNIPEPVPAYRLTSSTSETNAAGIDRRLLAGAAAGIVLLVGIGGWAIRTYQSTQMHALPSQGSVVSVAPNGAGKEFDGIWEFQLSGGEYCPLKSMTFQRKISNGTIATVDGRVIGSIDRDGKFRFANRSPLNQNLMVESQGAIEGENGQGSYSAVGTPCRGTYQIRFVNKLSG
ncbi:MAG: adenylate/guanylate cyclase domain-containing protein [Hyphomicrobiales bacterium]|nr:adenylate/guanylate cyclase domain-containing protein [Hyphomicrobiales bacterium]